MFLYFNIHNSSYFRFQNLPPNTNSSFICNLFVLWFDYMAILAYRRPLELKDLWNLEYKDKLDYMVPLFMGYWNKDAEKNK